MASIDTTKTVASLTYNGTSVQVGTDTSDATATATDMASGVTAYVNGEKVTGTVRTITGGIDASTTYSPYADGSNIRCEGKVSSDTLLRANAGIQVVMPSSNFGDATVEDVAAGKTFTSTDGVKVTGTLDTSGWAGTLTFSGSYATSTYYTAAGCRLGVDKEQGYGYVTIQSGTSSSYENIVFNSGTLPSGVSLLAPYASNHGTAGRTQQYFTCILTGITGKINVSVSLSAISSTYDRVEATLTVTYA